MSSEFERNEASRRSIRIKKKRAPAPPSVKTSYPDLDRDRDVNALIEQLICKQNERNQRSTTALEVGDAKSRDYVADLKIEEPDDSSAALAMIQRHIQQLEKAQDGAKKAQDFEDLKTFSKITQEKGLLTAGASSEIFQYLQPSASQELTSNFLRGAASRSSTGAVTSAIDAQGKKAARPVNRTASDAQKAENSRPVLKKLAVAPLGTSSTNSYKIQHKTPLKVRNGSGRGKEGDQVMGAKIQKILERS